MPSDTFPCLNPALHLLKPSLPPLPETPLQVVHSLSPDFRRRRPTRNEDWAHPAAAHLAGLPRWVLWHPPQHWLRRRSWWSREMKETERWKKQRTQTQSRFMVGHFYGSCLRYIFSFSCVHEIKTSYKFSLYSINQIHKCRWMLLWPVFLIRSDGVRNNHFVFENVCQTGITSPQVCSVVLSVKAMPLNVTHAWHPMRTTATGRAPPRALNMLMPAPPSQDPVSKHTPGKDSHTSVIWPVLIKPH